LSSPGPARDMIQQLSVSQLEKWLHRNNKAPLILDVREPWECMICSLPDSVYMPMGTVPARYNELDQDQDIVVLCHHGIRSDRVARFLGGQGFTRLFNLQGRIDAWAKDIETKMETY
jgi:rhodanese-related sulfurtransferase